MLARAKRRHRSAELARVEDLVCRAVGPEERRGRSPHPAQRPGLHLPGLSATPWRDARGSEAASLLCAAAPAIRRELLALLDGGQRFESYTEPDLSTFHTGRWGALYLRRSFEDLDGAHALCPETAAAVRALPRRMDLALFSGMNPGVHAEPHCGPTNLRLTLHLGLVVPPRCELRVGGEIRTWSDGACLFFDDSFEHEVWNRGPFTRFVLIASVWHPELTDVETEVLRELLRVGVVPHEEVPLPARWWVPPPP